MPDVTRYHIINGYMCQKWHVVMCVYDVIVIFPSVMVEIVC